MTVLIAEGMDKSGVERLRREGIQTVIPADHYDKGAVEGLVVRSVFQVQEGTLAEFPLLKVVAKLGTGLDNIDPECCRKKNIAVLHTPGMNSVSTAEFAVMQILNIYKNAFQIHERVRHLDYRRETYYGRELSGLVAGLIGYGSVGKNIADRLEPFVAKIYVCDRNLGDAASSGKRYFTSDSNRLLSESDIVVLALTLKGNEKMVNREFLQKVKRDLLLVNIARGGLVDEMALMEFLSRNRRAFYYCDVLEKEPNYDKPPEEQNYKNPLLGLPNVLFTPHIASLTSECQRKMSLEIAEKMITVLKGR